jgi:hypothetical protein
MATLLELATQQVADIDSQIQRVQDTSQAQISALRVRKRGLIDAIKALTPEMEATVSTFRDAGLLKDS